MALIDTDYLHQLQALLPPGPAWQVDDEATLTKLLAALSKELARVDGRAWQLIEEADPRTTAELFLDWERVAGLPDACLESSTMELAAGVYPLTESDLVLFSRPSMATYYSSLGVITTAAAGQPRFDHDPLTHAPRGLLIEGFSQNQIIYSEQFDNAVWSKYCAVTANAALAPDGNLTADLLVATSADSYIYQTAAFPGSTKFTFSIWLRSDVTTSIKLLIRSSPTGTDLANPSITITTYWQRFVVSGMNLVGEAGIFAAIGAYGSFSSGKSIYAWGAQLEIGASPTSYIKTSSSPASRSADIATIYRPISDSQKRAALVGKLTTLGGQSPAYFIGLAAAIGYAVSITEFRAHTVNDDVEFPIFSEAWNFAWQVSAALNTVSQITVESTVEDPLAVWGNALLECVINRLKPAHTTAIFSYA